MSSLRTTSRAALAALCIAALTAGPVAAANPTDDPALAADFSASYVARQMTAEGFVPVDPAFAQPDQLGQPEWTVTLDAILALQAAEVDAGILEVAIGTLAAEITSAIDSGGGPSGRSGKVLLISDAAGLGTEVGGVDLIATIEGTLQGPEDDDPGLYDRANPFGSVSSHSFALLGQMAHGITPPAEAIGWLAGQQCDDGGWSGYAAGPRQTGDPCLVTDPESGELVAAPSSTNQTAVAVQALAGRLGEQNSAAALAFLTGAQNDDGGFGELPGLESDANSTGIVVQALVSLGVDPAAVAPPGGDTSALGWLVGNQLGCDASSLDRGAFTGFFGTADVFASAQATWGLSLRPFPLGDTAAGTTAVFPDCPLSLERVDGTGRIETAIGLAAGAFPEGADTVVLATAGEYADALSGAPLATILDAPILLTDADVLLDVVASAIDNLGAARVVVLGGEAAVSSDVTDAVAALQGVAQVERVSGPERFSTAAAVADRLRAERAAAEEEAVDTDLDFGPETVFVAVGADRPGVPNSGFPDALGIAPLASFGADPIVLATTGDLPATSAEIIAGADEVILVGGPGALSPDVEAAVAAAAGPEVPVGRVFGADRYATAGAVADLALERGMSPSTTYLATGLGFADALAVGPIAGAEGAALVLADQLPAGGISPASSETLSNLAFGVDRLVAVGGIAAVPPQVLDIAGVAVRMDAR